jgi:hypothetical protein
MTNAGTADTDENIKVIDFSSKPTVKCDCDKRGPWKQGIKENFEQFRREGKVFYVHLIN